MIGDWVRVTYRELEESRRVGRINVILRGSVEVNVGENDDVLASFAFIEPIPLTTEIMEKNGILLANVSQHPYIYEELSDDELREIESHYPMYDYATEDHRVRITREPGCAQIKVYTQDNTYAGRKAEVIYVHELQHVLKMCGVDIDIVI